MTRDYMPGVPAAGHLTSGGFWHSNSAAACTRHPCGGVTHASLAVGDGVVYHARPGVRGEDGVVTGLSRDASMVFVRYADQHPGAPGRSTLIRMLTRTSGARPRGG